MARIRSIKPEIWLSAQVMNLSMQARLLFIGLITQADDEGRGSADARRIKAAIFGGDDVTSTDVRRWLDEISSQRLAVVYDSASDGILYQLLSWKDHQSIDRPKPSRYPAPDSGSQTPPPRRLVVDASTDDREGSDRKGSEGSDRKGSEGSSAREDQLRNCLIPEADHQAASDWIDHCQAMGRPVLPHQLIALGKTLASYGTPAQQRTVITGAIANGWRSLRASDRELAGASADNVITWRPPPDEQQEARA